MAGFENSVLVCENVNFNPLSPKPHNGTITLDGQLIIGSTALNAGGTHLNIGTLSSSGGSIVITNGPGTINLESSASVPTSFNANSGSAIPVANVLNILGSVVAAGTNPFRTVGAGNTITAQVQISQTLAAADATKIGLSNFDSASFTVAATGFVSLNPINYTSVNNAASPYTVLAADQYISVDTSGGAVTLRFPNAPTAKRQWIIKDRTGNAGANNITITTVGGAVNIDGATTFLINNNYGAVQMLANATPTYEIY